MGVTQTADLPLLCPPPRFSQWGKDALPDWLGQEGVSQTYHWSNFKGFCTIRCMSNNNPYEPFDPGSVENVGVTLVVELLEQTLHPMPPDSSFPGAGVYALYYAGEHSAYERLVELDGGRFKYPIYIGKAARENAKQGFSPRPAAKAKLYDRISQHASSIDAVDNLSLSDFRCRFLIINDAHIALAESVMIRVFRPPWNGMGFGSKVVGKERMSQRPSAWDSLHSGRTGRPVGSDDQEKKARAKIDQCVTELQQEIADPILKRMYERIMKFV